VFDLFDNLASPPGVASVHDDLETVLRQLRGDRAADAGRRSGHQRLRGLGVEPLICHGYSLT
jgi:hypothetical protein